MTIPTGRLDEFLELFRGLAGPPYRYTGGRRGETYEYCRRHGADCSGAIDVCFRKMGLPDPGGTMGISKALVARQPYRPDGWYPRGTIIINDNAAGWDWGDNSHVGVICDAEAQTIINSRLPDGVAAHEHHAETHQWARYKWTGYLPWLGADVDPRYFPGWFVHPALLAIFFATVARDDYELPEVLPVMCSLVELRSMWAPGNLAFCEVPGYREPLDVDSYGPFQQRPSQGWGTVDEVSDMTYALRAFCAEAANIRPAPELADAESLGEWIASVQRPREDQRRLYALEYNRARELIEEGRALIPLHSPSLPGSELKPNELVFSPINFAVATREDAIAAHTAAATLASRGIESFVVTRVNIPALEADVWNTPPGYHRMIVVGRAAYDLLHHRSQDRVFYPPQPNKSGYYGAVGEGHWDTVKRLARVLDTIDKGAGKDFEKRLAMTVQVARIMYIRLARTMYSLLRRFLKR